MSTLQPSPNKTIINDKAGEFNYTWLRWFSDLYNYINEPKNSTLSITTSNKTIENSSTETFLVSSVIKPNVLKSSSCILLKISGILSTAAIAPTITFKCRIGSTSLNGNVIFELVVTPDINQLNKSFFLDSIITIRAAGSVGAIIGNCVLSNNFSSNPLYFSDSTATVAVNTTVTNLIELSAKFNNAHISNSITLQNSIIEIKNIE